MKAAGEGHRRFHDLRQTRIDWPLQDAGPLAELGQLLMSAATRQRYVFLAKEPSQAVLRVVVASRG